VGLWGYGLFGTFVNSNSLFNNFKDVAAFNIFYIAQPILGMLPICYGQILLFLKVELFLGVLPCDWWSVSNPQNNRCSSIPPVLFRFLFRGGVLALWVFLALMLIGFPLGVLFSLISAITSAAFSFYLPYIFGLRVFHQSMSSAKKVWYVTAAVLSVVLSGIGIYSSIQAMADVGSASVFAFEQTCSAGGFFMGQYDSKGYHGKFGGYSNATGPGTFHDTFYAGTCYSNINCGQPGYGADGGGCSWADQSESVISCTGICNVTITA